MDNQLHYPAPMDTLLLIYIGLGLLHLTFRAEGLKRLGSLTKVLLMPTLLVYALLQGASFFLPTSLALATIGDYFLTKGNKAHNFTMGMVSFFLSHLCYSLYVACKPLHWIPLLISSCILLIILIYLILQLKGFPQALRYSLYLANLFTLTALCVGSGSLLASLGALAFIISDGMIAIGSLNRHQFSNTAEMALYILAQLLLVLGMVNL